MKIFKDRKSAGILLAKHLKNYTGKENTLVLGIPRGGVIVAAEIAKELKLPLDILVTRKIGAPSQEELALGAVDADGQLIWDSKLLSQLEFKISNLKFKIDNEMQEIKRREKEYRQSKESLKLKNKVVILVDDGIATGLTMLAAMNYLKKHQVEKIILAVPVCSKETRDKIIRKFNDFVEIITLETPEYFQSVGQFYYQFEPVEDEEVVQLLTEAGLSH